MRFIPRESSFVDSFVSDLLPTPLSPTSKIKYPESDFRNKIVILPSRFSGNACLKELENISFMISPQGIAFSMGRKISSTLQSN